MKNKIIIAIVSLSVVVCLAVGIGISDKNNNSENEIFSVSDAVSMAEKNTETKIQTNRASEEAETELQEKKTEEKATEQKTKKPDDTTVLTTKKNQTAEKTTVKKTEKETQAPIKDTENKKVTVSFSVNCEKAAAYDADYPKYLIKTTKCTVENGTTVFDLLNEECRKNGIALVHQNKSYVKAIGGLSERDCGNASGWTYLVNGVKPMMSASKYVLKDGDVVEWYYVTSPTD